MNGPPPPPKRKNHQPLAGHIAVGAGHNVPRSAVPETDFVGAERLIPDSVIGDGVEIHGEFCFEKLLRLDGKFQGVLLSTGDLIVGKRGCLIGDVNAIRNMTVEGGTVIGSITVERLVLMNSTKIKGNITCKILEVQGDEVTICGRANVHPVAPEFIDEHDSIIADFPKRARKRRHTKFQPIKMSDYEEPVAESVDPILSIPIAVEAPKARNSEPPVSKEAVRKEEMKEKAKPSIPLSKDVKPRSTEIKMTSEVVKEAPVSLSPEKHGHVEMKLVSDTSYESPRDTTSSAAIDEKKQPSKRKERNLVEELQETIAEAARIENEIKATVQTKENLAKSAENGKETPPCLQGERRNRLEEQRLEQLRKDESAAPSAASSPTKPTEAPLLAPSVDSLEPMPTEPAAADEEEAAGEGEALEDEVDISAGDEGEEGGDAAGEEETPGEEGAGGEDEPNIEDEPAADGDDAPAGEEGEDAGGEGKEFASLKEAFDS